MCRSLWQKSSTKISSFSKETYNFREATDRRHPICCGRLLQIIIRICVRPSFVTFYGHVQRSLGQYFQVHRGFPVVRDYWSGKRRDPIATVSSVKSILESSWFLKGGPEPLEKESHEFLGSKRDDRFSNPFFEMVPKTCRGSFFVPALAW